MTETASVAPEDEPSPPRKARGTNEDRIADEQSETLMSWIAGLLPGRQEKADGISSPR